VHQFIDAMIKGMYLFGACSLFIKTLPSFWPIQIGKGNIIFYQNGKFKFQIDLDRHGPRPLLSDSHLAEPPPFSLYTTFKGAKCEILDLFDFNAFYFMKCL
jgi:hypothetical protein